MRHTHALGTLAGIVVAALTIGACNGSSPARLPAAAPAVGAVAGQSGTVIAPSLGSGGVGTAGPQSAGSTAAPMVMNAVSTGGTTSAAAAGAGAAPGSGGSMAAVPNPATYTASIRIAQVAPGEEGTACIQVRLHNPAPINVVKIHNKLSPASHHFILSQVTDPAGAETELAPCTPFRGAIKGAPLTITQRKDDTVELPAGIAYNLGAMQVMHLELHYLNASTQTLDVDAQTELFPAAAEAATQEASVLLLGTGDISIPPHATADTGPKYVALPAGMDGVRFFAITGHTHRFGTNVTVSSAAGAGQSGALLYAPQMFQWDAPEMKHLDPAVAIPNGGGFSFDCAWNNPSDDVIGFGESALDEMCFFWAYYYPKKPVTNVLLDGVDLGPFLGGM